MSEGGRRVFGVRDFFCRSKKKSTNGGVEEDDGSGGWVSLILLLWRIFLFAECSI